MDISLLPKHIVSWKARRDAQHIITLINNEEAIEEIMYVKWLLKFRSTRRRLSTHVYLLEFGTQTNNVAKSMLTIPVTTNRAHFCC